MIKLKNIIRYEQLTDKSFTSFDNSNEEDVFSLLYCIRLPKETFEFYKNTFKTAPIAAKNEIKEVNEYMTVMQQFSKKSENEEESNHEKVSNTIMSLIFSGLDAHFVMEEMEIEDLPLFISGMEEKAKAKIENDRLWTFYNILPHVGKGIKSPQDLIKFPWEKEDKKSDIDSETIFNQFMENKIN
jgi:hypothetical protein